MVERSVLLARDDTIQLDDLPPDLSPQTAVGHESKPPELRAVRREAQEKAAADVERCAIIDCLEKAGWNVERAAKLAGFSRAQFCRLMQKHSISSPTQ